MNYSQLLQDSLRIQRTTKLVWAFAFISLISTSINFVDRWLSEGVFKTCIYFPVSIAATILFFIGDAGFIYFIHQILINQKPTFKEAWLQGKAKIFRVLLLVILFIPALLAAGFIIVFFQTRAPSSPFLWLFTLLMPLCGSLYNFGICAIMIDNEKVIAAFRISLRITFNNFINILIIGATIYFVRMMLIGPFVVVLKPDIFPSGVIFLLPLGSQVYQKVLDVPVIAAASWVIDFLLYPLMSIIWILCYIKFSKAGSYLAQKELQV